MILRILLPFFVIISLSAEERSWYPNTQFKLEAGLFLPTINGDISNTIENTEFKNDLGFDKSSASYFSLEYRLNYDYIPNFYISYFNLQEKADSTLSKSVEIANDAYSIGTKISSTLEYSSINAIIYQDFTIKGYTTVISGTKFYPGDIEFDIGLNVKSLIYKYSVQNKNDLTKPASWIEINGLIPLPYFGFKYYRYNILLYGDISALSFSEAKSTTAQIALDYRIVSGLYVSVGYLYEKFELVEDDDTIIFNTSGFKYSFKYKF